MNVEMQNLITVTRMQHAPTQSEDSVVLAMLDTVAMELLAQVSSFLLCGENGNVRFLNPQKISCRVHGFPLNLIEFINIP